MFNHHFRLLYIVLAAHAVIFAARLIGSFFPDDRVWGLNHASYISGMWLIYPILFLLTIYAFALIICPRLGNMIAFVTPRAASDSDGFQIARRERPGQLHGIILPPAIIIFSIAGFYFLCVKGYFLGDSFTMISILADPHIGFKLRSYGEMLLHHLYIQLLTQPGLYDAYSSYKHMSILSGVVFVTSVVYYGRRIVTSRFSYYSFVLLSLTAASVILFYGYVENYSIVSAALYLFFLSGLAAIENQRRSIAPIMAFGAAVFLHTIALVYLPSLLIFVVLALIRRRPAALLAKHSTVIIFLLLGSMSAFYAIIKLWGPYFWKFAFLPPFPDRFTQDNYFLFSISHLVDYANLLVFLIPVTVIALILHAGKATRRKADDPAEPVSGASLFMTSAVTTGLFAAFVMEPKLGMARDWDLMSILLIGSCMAGIYYWAGRFRNTIRYRVATVALVAVNISIFMPWLALNNSEESLYEYAISVMELDPEHSRSGFHTLRDYNKGNNHPVEAARLKIFCDENYPEMAFSVDGIDRYLAGDIDSAEMLFDLGLQANPSFFALYLNKAICQIEKQQYQEAEQNLEIADGLNPYSPYIYFFRGLCHYHRGDYDRAKKYWRKGIFFDSSNPLPFAALGYHYLTAHQSDSAYEYLIRFPDLYRAPIMYLRAGYSPLMKSDTITKFDELEYLLPVDEDTVLKRKLGNIRRDLLNTRQSKF